MEIKMTKPQDNSKALFDITCCITDTTTKLAGFQFGRIRNIFDVGSGLLKNLHSSPPSLIFSKKVSIYGSNNLR